jgi:GNAT superfamily N-acetyltransferase
MAYPMRLEHATPEQLEQAAAVNHTELFRQEAVTLGGSLLTEDGLSWTSGDAGTSSMIPFPKLPEDTAGPLLDRLMSWYLAHPPKGAGCWSLDPARPADLGVRLLARGFQPGWRPRWMALDLSQVQAYHPYPKGLTIAADKDTSLNAIKNLPYAQVIIPRESLAVMPGQWVRFVATLNGKVVGHSVVFLTAGAFGAAGIYHVGVIPKARHKGIGKAVTLAACLYAREKGYRYAVLNSTDAGQRTYEQLGFTVTGEGYTWWLLTERLLSRPPSPADVRLAEAIGRGDEDTLASLRSAYTAHQLNQPMTNGMTLMQLAVHFRQPAAAEWLAGSGAITSVLDAWDLQWKDRAWQLLREDPASVNQLYGEWNKTLLHVAAERNDEELARLALGAHPDLRLKDSAYQSTALEWARHFGHQAIVQLIQSAR